jgi:hypothetical protein
MAKSDLLKEAIADAKAVKETALANAKLALQEAFAPKLERMLATKLTNEIEGEEDLDLDGGEEAAMDMDAADMDMGAEGGEDLSGADVGDLSIDVDGDGEFDEFDIYSQEDELGAEGGEFDEEPVSDEDMAAEYTEEAYNGHAGTDGDELDLEAIIRELEGDLDNEEPMAEGASEDNASEDDVMSDDDANIDEIIESILREEDEAEEAPEANETEEMREELEEAYRTVKQLQKTINEVNLLNAKLLYTNKLFRNFELSETQKIKVLENFDRAGNTREAKLVFTTLAESFAKPKAKRVVKESYASKPVKSTAPSKETTNVLSEGFELANRWKKLAGLL